VTTTTATALTAALVAAQWLATAAVYRWVWGRWLQGWAWPFALGLLLFGLRAPRWEAS
jgi:hypothetical protein